MDQVSISFTETRALNPLHREVLLERVYAVARERGAVWMRGVVLAEIHPPADRLSDLPDDVLLAAIS